MAQLAIQVDFDLSNLVKAIWTNIVLRVLEQQFGSARMVGVVQS